MGIPAQYIPTLDGYGDEVDAANPLSRLMHRNRQHPPVKFREGPALDETGRFRMLQAHCAKRGKRHEFVVETREGRACLWCGIVRAAERCK